MYAWQRVDKSVNRNKLTSDPFGAPGSRFTHQYHVTGGDVHVRLGGLLAPRWGGAVGGGRAVLGAIAELGGDAAYTGRVRPPSAAGARGYGRPRHAPTAHAVLAAQGGFGRHVLPTQLLNGQ